MQSEHLEGYLVTLDQDATLDWYAKADQWGCECDHCRNFLEIVRKRMLPEAITKTLDRLGIPPEKATYVCELYTDDKGVHYQFSYRIAGMILSTLPHEKAPDHRGGRCSHEPYPYGAPNFPEPHFDLEFYAVLPWILV